MYKPPNTALYGKAVEMKFKVAAGKTEWFKGLTGKYGVSFPCDGETVYYVYPNDKDMKFV